MKEVEIIEKCIRVSKETAKKKAIWTREFPTGKDQNVITVNAVQYLLRDLEKQLKKELLNCNEKEWDKK